MLDTAKITALAAMVVVSMMLTGCGSGTQKTTGFLSTYDNLEPEAGRLVYMNNDRLATYDKFIIDPIKVKLYDGAHAEKARSEGKLTRQEIDQIVTYAKASLTRALTDAGYPVVTSPSDRTLRFRIAITDLKEATAALNILPQTKATGLGAGRISIEAEAVDSKSRAQVGALVATRSGEFLWVSEGLSGMGDAKKAIDEWADDFVARLRKARGQ